MKTAAAAAVLADEYVLIHANGSAVDDPKHSRDQQRDFRSRPSKSLSGTQVLAMEAVRHVPGTDGRLELAKVCHGCRNKGHCK